MLLSFYETHKNNGDHSRKDGRGDGGRGRGCGHGGGRGGNSGGDGAAIWFIQSLGRCSHKVLFPT